MVLITNHESGEIVLTNDAGHSLRLVYEVANRLVMMARMHTVVEFRQKLPGLISDESLLNEIKTAFEGRTSSERWNVKEKFARLQTVVKGHEIKNSNRVVEEVKI